MILSPALAEKAAALAATSEDILPLFPAMERAVIMALKLMRIEKESREDQSRQREQVCNTGDLTHESLRLIKT